METTLNAYLENSIEEEEVILKEKTTTLDLDSQSIFLTDNALSEAILNLFDEAEWEICIASPWIDHSEMIEKKLKELDQKKIKIQLLTRTPDTKKHRTALDDFIDQDFNFEINDSLHTKMIIIDERKMYVGSANIVERSLSSNQEAGIITEDPYLVKPAVEYFDRMYRKALREKIKKK